MLQCRNDKIKQHLASLLKEFYDVVLHNHNRKEEKKQVLGVFLKKLDHPSKENVLVLNPKVKNQYESLTTIADFDNTQFNSRFPCISSSNLLKTNFLSHIINRSFHTINRSEIKAGPAFVSKCVYKLILFGLWINHLQISQVVSPADNQDHLSYSHKLAQRSLKVLKEAMRKALQSMKSANKRKHAKNAYLFKQLLYYTDSNLDLKLHYINLTVEQLDSDFLAKSFECLWEESELIYSRSIIESSSFVVDFSQLIMLEEINKSLEALNAQLIVVEANGEEEAWEGKGLNILVEELACGLYRLKDIITLQLSEEPEPNTD